jgi:hypothetical protein
VIKARKLLHSVNEAAQREEVSAQKRREEIKFIIGPTDEDRKDFVDGMVERDDGSYNEL